MERETGIEPAPSAWKAEVLPLNYSRAVRYFRACMNPTGGGRWIRTTEGVSQQIYSLPPLAAWVSLRSSRKPVKQPVILTMRRGAANALVEDSPGARGQRWSAARLTPSP